MKLRRPHKDIDLGVKELVLEGLRDRHPWMKINAVHDLAMQCSKTFVEGIEKQAPIIEASKARINFLSLPPELRNRIYELVLVKGRQDDDTGYIEPIDVREDGREDIDESPRVWMQQPYLTVVCRQIRNETLPVYYGLNTFELQVEVYTSKPVLNYLSKDAADFPVSAAIRNCTAFADTFKWLLAIGARNVGLIKRLDIEFHASKRRSSAVFASLHPHTETIEREIRRIFEDYLPTSPPTIRVLARDKAVGDPASSEAILPDEDKTWKELLQIKPSAADPETSVST